jgi:large repetitive protein
MLFSMVIPQSVSANTEPVTLAKWDFSNTADKLKATSGIDANLDKTLSATGPTISSTYVAGPTSGISVPNASPWTNNPSFWKVSVSTKGYQNITLSSKQYGSNTGPRDFKLQYSLDGNNWVDISGGTVTLVSSTWSSTSVTLPSEANDVDVISVRWLKTSEIAINGGAIGSSGTSRMGEIEFKGEPAGTTPVPSETTAKPDATKITYGTYTTVTGAAGAVAGNATVNVYSDTNALLGTTTATAEGSFSATINNPDFKAAVQVAAQESGKALSEKVTVNYEGAVVQKTANPDASKVTYNQYTNVIGAAGAVEANATVTVYYDTNTQVGTTTAAADGSFNVAIANSQAKANVQVSAQATGKDVSDKVTISYTGVVTPPVTVNPGDVVFSQLYVNGGNSGAFYKQKFFELYNNTDKDIDLSNWSIAYTSASTMSFNAGQPLSGVIKAHSYFLIGGSTGATGAVLPVTPDATTTLNPSGSTGGAFVLAKKKTAVTGVDDPDAIDLLAYTNGTAVYKNPLYWGEPISAQNIGSGTILRKTNIGSDPRSAYGLGNGWFTKDPSKDFVINTLSGTSAPHELIVRNSKYMVSPNASKISFADTTVTGQAGSVPALAIVNAYVDNNGVFANPVQATAQADGSFTLNLPATASAVYVTHLDNTQPTPIESSFARIDKAGTSNAVTALSELRKNAPNGTPASLGYKTTIEGVATTENTSDTNVKTNFYLQDATGAIQVVSNITPATPIQIGQKYTIEGQVVFSAGMTQFVPTDIKLATGGTTLAPAQVAINELGENAESKLVTFVGKVSNIPTGETGTSTDLTVTDDAGNLIIVKVQGALGDIEQGSSYTFTGNLNQFKKAPPFTTGYYLLPTDIKGQLILNHTPIEKAYIGTDVSFKAYARHADSVTLYYTASTTEPHKAINMTSADGRNYNGKLPKEYVPEGKFYYYIEAKSGDIALQSAITEVAVVEDKDGPLFYNPAPMNGELIETMIPTIFVQMEDPNGVNVSTATITLDGQDFTSKATITETGIKLKITTADILAEGPHTVVVTAKDGLDNLGEFTWSFEVAERFISGNHYRGTTHNHTNISHDATGSPEDSLKAAQKYNYDYYVFSDHSHDIDADIRNTDTVDRQGMKERSGGADWKLTHDLSTQYTKDGEFVVFPGFEMTSTTWGHSNVIGTDNFIDRLVDGGAYQQLQKYYNWTLTYDDIVAQFNHPKMSANAFNNFIPYDKNVDQLFTMLEVGNGSGKYSYARAEDSFYSALDLGWHVAPTYGEDNHDATWGQTKRRTVIVASDLTEASLVDSMRKMRVYMSEDPNATLDVSASGFYMGSTVDTDTLDFKITGNDPVLELASDPDYSYIKTTSNDEIQKVELITNQGRVVDTYVPTTATTSINWEPSLTVAGGQQWFVVKVTQKDGDWILSAPIWSPEKDLAVNVSDVSVVEGAMIGGVPATLKAGVSNRGKINVNNITAKFYYDSIDATHLIGEATIDALAANASTSVTVNWPTPVAGTHNIIVVLSAADGNDLGDNKYEQSFVIKPPLNKVVMIDGSHQNENTKTDTGSYKDNFKLFTLLLKQQGYTVVENANPLTDDLLKTVHALVITHPQSAYSDAEIAVINTFVTNGGSLLVTEKSNFGGSNQNLNSLLAGVGSTILVNNDGVFDETKEGNFWGTPLTANFAVRLHPKPVRNALTDRVPDLDYYSGTSLAKNDGTGNKVALTDSDTVTVLVSGNETTFQGSTSMKSDSVAYNVHTSNGSAGPALTDITGGSAIPMIASEQIGNGRVFVSGMNIFNDKQMDQTYNPKGNVPFALNVVKWLTHLEPQILKISDARKLAEDTDTVVEGTVTTGAGVFFDAFYLQDETGGIMAFNEVPVGSLKAGDKVRVYGHIKTFENNTEIIFNSFANDVIKLGEVAPPQPKLVPTGEATSEANMGLLVKVVGQVTAVPDDTTYIVNDGSGDTLVFTDGYIINQTGPIPVLKVGDTLEAVGISGKYSEGERIRVRDTRELVGTVKQVPVPDAPVVNPVNDADEVITGTAKDGETVIAKVNGQEIGNVTVGATNNFSIQISKQAAGTIISVTATDANGREGAATLVTVSDLSAPAAPTVNAVTDVDTVVTGTAEAGAQVVAKVGTETIGQATAEATGAFSISIEKQAAGTIISVTATDAVNNTSSATVVTVTDVTAPAAPTVNAVTDVDTVVTGTAEAGVQVVAKVGNQEIGQATAEATGAFSISIEKQAAGTIISVTANDAANNTSSATVVTVTDVTAPAAPVVNGVTDVDTVVTGTAEAGVQVVAKVGNQEIGQATATTNGAFSITIAKQTVGTVIALTATDAAGNSSTATEVTVTDGTAPAAPVVNGVTEDTSILTGTAEAGAKVVAKAGTQVLGEATATLGGAFSITIGKQTAGTVISVTATDVAGNTSPATAVMVVRVPVVVEPTPEPTPTPKPNFTDVAPGHWAKEYIDFLVEEGHINGVSQTSFNPEGKLTRGQFVGMIVRSLGLSDGSVGLANEIQIAYANGITTLEPSKFEATKEITREQMAAMIVRAYEKQTGKDFTATTTASYKDGKKISGKLAAEVAAANELGFMAGYKNGTFGPKESANRAQGAKVVYTFLKK